ncbi:MAG TPA: sensor histidine kinase [Streptomyces sp.]|jgi:signal transduction histidine kinase|nr:sensor histidine kinase [Streptomyces sp.]
MTDTPVALIMFLALGAVAVVLALLLVRALQEVSRLRLSSGATETELEGAERRSTDLAARLQAIEAELRHLVGARIPDLASSLNHPGVAVRGPLGTATLSPDIDRSIDAVLGQVTEEVTKERQRVDFAAQAAMRGATTTMQALLYQLQSLLQRMQEKYDDPLVAEDLLAADFLNEQALRRIQSTAVVCGAWPGLTRENSHVGDIIVGAVSRLSGYERVQVTNRLRDPVGVVARAVEPVAVTLTELMANALHYSHPDLPVTVTLQQGNRGVSVIIDDAGVGMHSDEVTRTERLMSGTEPVLITELGDPPRNGFATIGQLVRQYGFSTHIEASPYGGVRAVVHIPGEPLLTLIDEDEQPTSAMTPTPPEGTPVPGLPGRAATDSRPPASAPGADPEFGTPQPEDLPRRRRRRPAGDVATPKVTGDADAAAGPSVTAATPEESAELWSAFQKGTASGRAAVESRTVREEHAAGAGAEQAIPGITDAAGADKGTGRGDGTVRAEGRAASGPAESATAKSKDDTGPSDDARASDTESSTSKAHSGKTHASDDGDDADPAAPEGNPPA